MGRGCRSCVQFVKNEDNLRNYMDVYNNVDEFSKTNSIWKRSISAGNLRVQRILLRHMQLVPGKGSDRRSWIPPREV